MYKNKSKSLKSLFSMKKRNVLIIGGAGYLGKAMTESLLELGANIIVSSRNKNQAIKELKKLKGKIYFYPVDIKNDKSIYTLSQFVIKKFKNIWNFKF